MRGFDVTKNGVNRIIGLTVRFMRVGQTALFWQNMVIWRIGEYVCGDSSFAAIHGVWVGCAEVV